MAVIGLHPDLSGFLLSVAGTLVYIGDGDILETEDSPDIIIVQASGIPPEEE